MTHLSGPFGGPTNGPITGPLIGLGTDVHRLAPGIPLWLGGVLWPDEPEGLEGHSDGDAVAHAMVDALFSAAAMGDIGHHFGTDAPAWAGASGVAFLEEASLRVRDAGFRIGNVAVQVIGNRPKIGSRREEIQALLGDVVGARVSVAGTTTDGLGLTGRGEGIAAMATALLF